MKAFSRIALALLLCLGTTALATAEITPGSKSSRLFPNSNSENDVVRDNSISSTIWSLIDLENFSSFAHNEAIRFELPKILHEEEAERSHRRLQEEKELLIQEEGTAEAFDPNDIIVSVTFSEICKSFERWSLHICDQNALLYFLTPTTPTFLRVFCTLLVWPPKTTNSLLTDKVIIFIAISWLLGNLSVYIGLPSLVGELVTGFVLGPPLLDFVPFPGALVLTGNLGLIGLILESGISLDVDQLKEVGSRALLMATVGSVIPLGTGFGIGRWMGLSVKPAIAVGAAFAPSSLGVASNALSTGDVLNTPIGQTIVASSVFDDVLGLILLSILEVFAAPDPSVFQYVLPFISSFGYLIVLGMLGITVFPRVIENRILPLVSESNRDQLAMVLMLVLTICYMLALNYSRASYLTGVFLAGLTFSQLHMVHASFVQHGRPMLNWLLRIFFAATIGFQVPITSFSDIYILRWGFALCKFEIPRSFRCFQYNID